MSAESRIKANGRWVLQSPVLTGIAVTLGLLTPTLLSPAVPLWISLSLLVSIGPLIVLAFHLLYERYGRPFGSKEASTGSTSETPTQTPFDILKHRYANGEIDTDTFERRLETLLHTEERTQQVESHDKQVDELSVRNQ